MSDAEHGRHDAPKPGAAAEGERAPEVQVRTPAGGSPMTEADRRKVATPGDGASATKPQGDEVDPGVG